LIAALDEAWYEFSSIRTYRTGGAARDSKIARRQPDNGAERRKDVA